MHAVDSSAMLPAHVPYTLAHTYIPMHVYLLEKLLMHAPRNQALNHGARLVGRLLYVLK